jgi:glycosyltransferase involved in cell wall biosynthesis
VIRVGFVCDTFELGGQEQGCLEVMRRLDRARFEPYFFTFRPGSLIPEVRALGIPVSIGYVRPGLETTWSEQDECARKEYSKRLSQELHSRGIDACLIYAWRDGVEAARDADVTAVVERVDGLGLSSRVSNKSLCDKIICESTIARDILLAQRHILKCRREQLVVIPNGVDLKRFNPEIYDKSECRRALGFAPDDFVVCTVARLAPEKNQSQLLQALRYLIDSEQRVQLSDNRGSIRGLIVGPDGGCARQLETEAEQLGISDQVHFLGARPDIPEILAAADAFALTSFTEGTPFALLEAMAMGLPIVATQVGSIVEVIDGNGFLVGVLRPEQTYKALSDLRQDPGLGRRLGRRSRKLAQRFDIDKMMKRYEEVLVEAHASAAIARAKSGQPKMVAS